jgi:hypothetical protein
MTATTTQQCPFENKLGQRSARFQKPVRCVLLEGHAGEHKFFAVNRCGLDVPPAKTP